MEDVIFRNYSSWKNMRKEILKLHAYLNSKGAASTFAL